MAIKSRVTSANRDGPISVATSQSLDATIGSANQAFCYLTGVDGRFDGSGVQVVGFDVMELTPQLDPTGVSNVVAAKVVRELLLV